MVPLISAISDLASGLQQAAPSTAAPAANQLSFGDMVAQAAREAVGTMQQGEAAAIEGVKGSMPTFKVVDSVMSRAARPSTNSRDPRQGRFRLSGNHPHGDLTCR